jgi:signal transduction histidine kinase
MKVSYNLYFLANRPFWFHIPLFDQSDVEIEIVRIDKPPLSKNGFVTISPNEINIPGFQGKDGNKYDIYQTEELIIIQPHQLTLKLNSDKERMSILQTIGMAYSDRFRNETKTALIEQLSHPTNKESTKDILVAFRQYTFFNNISIWLYNQITKMFTRITGDIPAVPDFIHEDKSFVLKTALSKTIKCDVLRKYDVPDKLNKDIKWANVFNIETEDTSGTSDIKVVVCMYSTYIDYNLRKETQQLMKSFFQQNLANRYFDRLLRLTDLREHIRPSINLDQPRLFLSELAKKICNDLSWESCAIFLESEKKNILELVANYPTVESSSDVSKCYDIKGKSLTSQVFSTNKILWSYDIENDPRNTHVIDDLTASPPRDWIGVPISSPFTSKALGVLRVKNKRMTSEADDSHFCNLDMYILQVLASEISSILHHSNLLFERQQHVEQRAKELSELEDFLKTFRHEIRNPIQAVCMAPERIGFILRDEGMITKEGISKKLFEFLTDFKATGNRLEMISQSLTLNPEEIVKDIRHHNLFKDCIAPVLAFTTPFAIRRKRQIKVDKDSLLINVTCDAVSISMAFHVLIDNAIKYTDKDNMIEVFGRAVPNDGYEVMVVSKSKIFEISDEEALHIREKYYRGEMAKRQKLEGSGIGLYLADKIMELNNGALVLLSKKYPVTFSLRLK